MANIKSFKEFCRGVIFTYEMTELLPECKPDNDMVVVDTSLSTVSDTQRHNDTHHDTL